MPRLLDPLERRAEICEAVWRLIAHGGVRAIWRAAVCSTVARDDRALVRLHLGDLAGPDLLATETLEPSQD